MVLPAPVIAFGGQGKCALLANHGVFRFFRIHRAQCRQAIQFVFPCLLLCTPASRQVQHHRQLVRLTGNPTERHQQGRGGLTHGATHGEIVTFQQIGYGVVARKALHHVAGGFVDHVVDDTTTTQNHTGKYSGHCSTETCIAPVSRTGGFLKTRHNVIPSTFLRFCCAEHLFRTGVSPGRGSTHNLLRFVTKTVLSPTTPCFYETRPAIGYGVSNAF